MPTKEMVRLDLPHILTPLPGPRATDVIERDSQVLSPSYTRCYPLVAARGEGAMIEDVDGNRFLDFNAGIAVASTGHCHPKVVEAIEEQSKRLIHMSGTDFYYENMVQLAEKLASIAPGAGSHRVYFGNSGTEATMSALRLARGFTGRDLIIKFEGCYHGHVDSLLVKGGSGMATLGIADSAGVPKAFAETTISLPFNSVVAVEQAFADRGGQGAARNAEEYASGRYGRGCVRQAAGKASADREGRDR